LFTWNGILIQLADGSCVEYVHLSAVHVAVGDDVKQGQHIGDSGSVGFSPVPHLHIQLLADASKTAWTKPFCFRDAQGRNYTPVAGDWYDASGPVAHPTTVS
jgi:murein DD-endopeptidase MepM/ murein hydrolase activator NlpD